MRGRNKREKGRKEPEIKEGGGEWGSLWIKEKQGQGERQNETDGGDKKTVKGDKMWRQTGK